MRVHIKEATAHRDTVQSQLDFWYTIIGTPLDNLNNNYIMAKSDPPMSLADIATEKIRDWILDLTLKPGTQLDESFLRDKLDISRTPAREALNRLASEGLVESHANRGFYVTSLDVHRTARFFDSFFIVEMASAQLCLFEHPNLVQDLLDIQAKHYEAVTQNQFLKVSRYNAEFHIRLIEATDNEHLLSFARRVHNYARRLVYFIYVTESGDEHFFLGQQSKITTEHDLIIDAIRQHDRQALVEIMAAHANRFRTRLLRFINGRWDTPTEVFDAIKAILPPRE